MRHVTSLCAMLCSSANLTFFAGQQVSQNEFDNEYGTMSMGVGRFFPDFDDYPVEDEVQTVNETIPVSIASMLW